MPEPLSLDRLRALIATSLAGDFGQRLEYHPQIGSTNDRLRELAEQGAPRGTLVITDEQIAGRGRMGRRWDAPARTAVLMSLLFRPTLSPELANRLVMCCGLAIREAAKPVQVDVKWPNDLLVGGKKVAGILPESAIIADRLQYVMVGMGINTNNRFTSGEPLAEKATSLRDARGEPVEREGFVAAVLHHINRLYARLHHAWLHREWERACVTVGRYVRLSTPAGDTLEGTAEGITSAGQLTIRSPDGTHHTLSLSEASILSAKGLDGNAP